MKSAIFRSFIWTAVLLSVSLIVSAQPGDGKTGQMFAGETLTYEGRVSRLRVSISIAELTFLASALPDSNDLLIRSEAVSKGSLLKLFRYSFLQEYGSTLDLGKFRILKTTKHDVQKQRVRDGEAVFDYNARRVNYVETDPNEAMRPPRRIASEIGDQMYDMVSAIYAVRLLPLAVGKRYEFSVSDSGLVYKVPFTVTKREMKKTILGKVWCFRIEPDIFGTGKLIEQKGKMVIWMTEDARHTPVRAEVNTDYGKVNIKLKSAVVPG